MDRRAPTEDDMPVVVALMRAAQEADGDTPDMTSAALRRDWEEIDLAQDAILLLNNDGRPIAYADLINRRYVQISLFASIPEQPGREQLWRKILAWGEQWLMQRLHLAPPASRVAIQSFIRSTNTVAATVLEAQGYSQVRTHYVMQIRLIEPPTAPQWPVEIGPQIYRPGIDDQLLFGAGEEAFQDLWDRPPSTLERWLLPTRSESFDASLWFLAWDAAQEQVAGVCLCSVTDGQGHVDVVGVRPAWRRRGIGLALLQHALRAFLDRGVEVVELSVDAASPTAAPQLYRRAGFRVHQSYARFQKVIRPGSLYLPDP